uniref:Uncharacterized protein n=1 Tax=Plectus sambesii TaxID=2011161 RepID=A0A914V6N0_9BILA
MCRDHFRRANPIRPESATDRIKVVSTLSASGALLLPNRTVSTPPEIAPGASFATGLVRCFSLFRRDKRADANHTFVQAGGHKTTPATLLTRILPFERSIGVNNNGDNRVTGGWRRSGAGRKVSSVALEQRRERDRGVACRR